MSHEPAAPGAVAVSDGCAGTLQELLALIAPRGALPRDPRVAWLLDYDGTLVALVDRPGDARPDPEVLDLLGRLATAPGALVEVVSGRSRAVLDAWLGSLPVGLNAEHGLWRKARGASTWTPTLSVDTSWLPLAAEVIAQATGQVPGAHLELKSATLAWHYRIADRARVVAPLRDLRRDLEVLAERHDLSLVNGAEVLELRCRGVHKGLVPARLLAEHPGILIVAIGDDQTDEDLFRGVPPDGLSIKVGVGPSIARWRLHDVAAVRSLLAGAAPARETQPLRADVEPTQDAPDREH
ncbi:MAG: trehalose-phosphatase [Deltaproteobacteria bacterium]|nr:trehalose-phosphatase [Deltaproteobacteria bacterium]